MAVPEVRQRLAAILATDVAGYARLMEADEAATVAALVEAAEAARSW
jgi:class 3 adenylate cyclase